MWEASLTMGGTWLAHRRPSGKGHDLSPYKGHRCLTLKGTILKLTAVQFMNGLRPSNNGLFVNGFNLATVPTVMLVPC